MNKKQTGILMCGGGINPEAFVGEQEEARFFGLYTFPHYEAEMKRRGLSIEQGVGYAEIWT
jgi:hypothetical protein